MEAMRRERLWRVGSGISGGGRVTSGECRGQPEGGEVESFLVVLQYLGGMQVVTLHSR